MLSNKRKWIVGATAAGLLLVLGAALWGSAHRQAQVSDLLRNLNHLFWAGVNADRLFGGRH
jgi:hypothetical protein